MNCRTCNSTISDDDELLQVVRLGTRNDGKREGRSEVHHADCATVNDVR